MSSICVDSPFTLHSLGSLWRRLLPAAALVVAPAWVHAQQAAPATSQPAAPLMTPAIASQVRELLQPAIASPSDLEAVARTGLRRGIRQLIDRTIVNPESGSGASASQHQVTVVAEKGEVNGRARFYLPVNEHADWITTFTGPLTAGSATFATEAGLGRNVSVNTGIKFQLWSYSDTPGTGAAASTTQRQASTYLQSFNMALGLRPDATPAGLEALRRLAVAAGGLRTGAPNAAASLTTSESVAAGLQQAGQSRLLSILASPSLVNSPERFWAAIAQDPAIVRTTWAAQITPGGEVSRSAGDYLTDDTREKKPFDKTTGLFSFSGGVSRVATVKKPGGTSEDTLNTPLFFAGVSSRGGSGFKVPDAQNICVPSTGGSTECLTLPVGAPTTITFRSVTIEYRHWELNRSFGINPKYTYTSQRPRNVAEAKPSRVYTFEVPIYFMHKVTDINNRDFDFGSDLVGGVNIGWRNSGSKEGAFVTLFLTKAFGLP